MGKYLITGRSGTGKTAICRELVKQGYTAFDGDKVPNLSGWCNKETGEYIGKLYPGDSKVQLFDWNWDRDILAELLTQTGNIYFCGNADNAASFYTLFDQVFILALNEDEQRRRINNRTDHDYGKDLQVQDSIIIGQVELVEYALSHGAKAIDATPEIGAVVRSILDQTVHHEH